MPVRDSDGNLSKWKDGAEPDCEHCPNPRLWTDENRALVALVDAWIATNGNESLLCAWGWTPEDWKTERFRDALLLIPAERKRIDRMIAQHDFLRVFGKAKHGDKT